MIQVVIQCVSICLYQQDQIMEKVQTLGSPEFDIGRQSHIIQYICNISIRCTMNITEICRHVKHSYRTIYIPFRLKKKLYRRR